MDFTILKNSANISTIFLYQGPFTKPPFGDKEIKHEAIEGEYRRPSEER